MDVVVSVQGQGKLVFKDAKASTERTNHPQADLFVYRGEERIAHFVAGQWVYWLAQEGVSAST